MIVLLTKPTDWPCFLSSFLPYLAEWLQDDCWGKGSLMDTATSNCNAQNKQVVGLYRWINLDIIFFASSSKHTFAPSGEVL